MGGNQKFSRGLEPVCHVCSVETCAIYAECKGLVNKNGK